MLFPNMLHKLTYDAALAKPLCVLCYFFSYGQNSNLIVGKKLCLCLSGQTQPVQQMPSKETLRPLSELFTSPYHTCPKANPVLLFLREIMTFIY